MTESQTESTNTEAEVLVPRKYTVDINGETFEVKKFTLSKWIEVSREIVQFIGAVIKRVQDDIPDVDVGRMSWQLFLPYVWEELSKLAPILGAAINKDAEWMLNQTDLAGIINLLNVVVEINDFKGVVENFTRTYKIVKNPKQEKKEEALENAST